MKTEIKISLGFIVLLLLIILSRERNKTLSHSLRMVGFCLWKAA